MFRFQHQKDKSLGKINIPICHQFCRSALNEKAMLTHSYPPNRPKIEKMMILSYFWFGLDYLQPTNNVGRCSVVSQHWCPVHRSGNVTLTKFSSLDTTDVVKMMTSCAANDNNFFNITTFPFPCITVYVRFSHLRLPCRATWSWFCSSSAGGCLEVWMFGHPVTDLIVGSTQDPVGYRYLIDIVRGSILIS